jgi:hypothetical protein
LILLPSLFSLLRVHRNRFHPLRAGAANGIIFP